MKKILLLLIPIITWGCETNPPTQPTSVKSGEVQIEITISEDNNISSNRTVLLEDFANVSCTPCLTSNKIIQSVLNSYGSSQIVSIKFPTNFPSPVDPMYLTAKEFCDFRMTFYNILFAPTIIFDGITRPTPTDSNSVKQVLNNRLTVSSDFDITITKTIVNGGLLINADVKVKNISSINQNELFLRCAIVESEVEYAQAPGSNGETIFYDVIRVILPSNDGISLLSIGSTQTYQFENTIDTVWNINKLEAVVFIQSLTNKEIHQTGSSF